MSLRTMRSAVSKAACFKLALARDSLRRLEVCRLYGSQLLTAAFDRIVHRRPAGVLRGGLVATHTKDLSPSGQVLLSGVIESCPFTGCREVASADGGEWW